MATPRVNALPSSLSSARPLVLGMTAAAAAGVLLLLAGATILMGIITADALYPDVYTTHDNEISDLGATRPPDSIIRQPSATVFNSVMIVSGIAILLASGLLHRAFRARRVTIPIALLGIGVLGVGIFPGNNATFHPIFALMAFVSGGIAAVLSGHIQGVPARYLSRLLGIIALGAIVVGMAGETTVVFEEMGDGGIERWIAYPVVLWVTYFGGWLSASGSMEDPERHW